MKRQIPCACGCGALSTPNRMETVRMQYRHGYRQRPGGAFLVLAGCAEPFQRELGIEAVLMEFVRVHGARWWPHRLRKTPSLYALFRSRHERLKGTAGARREALKRVAAWLTPKFIAHRQKQAGRDNQ